MLLGRDRELRTLEDLLAAARAGSSGVLALAGEPGIGKSTLLEWAAAHADGMNVLRARGVQSEAHIPFAGLLELLRPALDAVGRLPAPQAAALASALALRPAQEHDRFAVGAATLSLLAAHAELAPLLVLIDDAHWLDGSSADALRFALRRLVADPIAVVLSARDDEPSLLDGTDLRVVRVGGLDLDATGALVQRASPGTSAAATERLHRETGGNPLALLELGRERRDDLPIETPVPATTTIAAAYLQRAHGLADRTRAALVVVAASDAGDLAVLTRAGVVVGDLVAAESAGLVSLGAGSVEFRHPLVRSAIYGDASPEARRGAHRALADALPDAEADRRAWHLALAATGPDARASSALEQAGMRARARSAYDVASHAFERASRLSGEDARRGALLHVAAETAWLAGLPDRANALLGEATRHARDEALLIDIERLRGRIAVRRGPLDEGRAILLAAAARARDASPDVAVAILADATEGAFYAGDAAGMQACGEEALALADSSSGDRASFFARMSAGMGRVLGGEQDGIDLIREAVTLLRRSDALADVRLEAWGVIGSLWLREEGPDEELVEAAIDAARAQSAAGSLPHLLIHIGLDQTESGRLGDAQSTFDEAVRLARETGQHTILTGALARLAWVEGRRGLDDACRVHAEEARALGREVGPHLFEVWALAALAELELARGDADAALSRADEQQAALDAYRIADVDLSPGPERVELLLRAGRRDEARAVGNEVTRAAEAKSQPWALARSARARGLLDDDFEREFEDALAFHARTRDVFERARTELAYGSRLRRAGQRSRAREQLRAALGAFDDLGAAPWGELARAELAATGETARRRDPSTLADLTPQELKVATLLAGGRTTREVAAGLFLSPKTIEYHLRNVYRKLDVSTRDELARALA